MSQTRKFRILIPRKIYKHINQIEDVLEYHQNNATAAALAKQQSEGNLACFYSENTKKQLPQLGVNAYPGLCKLSFSGNWGVYSITTNLENEIGRLRVICSCTLNSRFVNYLFLTTQFFTGILRKTQSNYIWYH